MGHKLPIMSLIVYHSCFTIIFYNLKEPKFFYHVICIIAIQNIPIDTFVATDKTHTRDLNVAIIEFQRRIVLP